MEAYGYIWVLVFFELIMATHDSIWQHMIIRVSQLSQANYFRMVKWADTATYGYIWLLILSS